MNSIKEVTQLCLLENARVDETLNFINNKIDTLENKRDKARCKIA